MWDLQCLRTIMVGIQTTPEHVNALNVNVCSACCETQPNCCLHVAVHSSSVVWLCSTVPDGGVMPQTCTECGTSLQQCPFCRMDIQTRITLYK